MKSLKKLILFLPLCIAFASCESDEVAPADSIMSQELTQDASSGATVQQTTYQIDFSEYDPYMVLPCDDVLLRSTAGIVRIRITVVYNKNTAVVHSTISGANLEFTDVNTGARYVGGWVNNYTAHYDFPDSSPYHTIQTQSIVLTTPGKENNVVFKIDSHTKIDADGNVIVYTDNYRMDCQK